jgi:hypothetical protein
MALYNIYLGKDNRLWTTSEATSASTLTKAETRERSTDLGWITEGQKGRQHLMHSQGGPGKGRTTFPCRRDDISTLSQYASTPQNWL